MPLIQKRKSNEMHDVLHYYGNPTVIITPSLRHFALLLIPQDVCHFLISELFDSFCGLQNGDKTSTLIISLQQLQ
jgi:hypothetical protein